MFCPSCRDEFRAGFTHCEGCDVDLVESLDASPGGGGPAAAAAAPDPKSEPVGPMQDYCGFLTLEDARHARETLRGGRIRSEIVIRDSPEPSTDDGFAEEYWLRVDGTKLRQAAALIESIGPDSGEAP